MKCSAVRKDFWCLTNKVNQIITISCSSLTLCDLLCLSLSFDKLQIVSLLRWTACWLENPMTYTLTLFLS